LLKPGIACCHPNPSPKQHTLSSSPPLYHFPIMTTDDVAKHSRAHREEEGIMYTILRPLAKFAVTSYFRKTKFIIHKDVPRTGPMLITHANMVLDPAMVIASAPYDRPAHFWAMSKFFANPVVAFVLTSAGVVSVDVKNHQNDKLYASTFKTLEKGEVVALFPEGTSYTAPHILQMKDGLSWVAFEFAKKQAEGNVVEGLGRQPIAIIPTGITYTNKNKWRHDVIVEYAKPIYINTAMLTEFTGDPKATVKRLTARIAEECFKLTINAPDWDTSLAGTTARRIMFGDRNGVMLDDYRQVSQSFTNIFHPNNVIDNPTLTTLKSRLLTYNATLQLLQLSNRDISLYQINGISLGASSLRLIVTTLGLVLELPFFLPVIVFHSPMYALGKFAEKIEHYQESVAQDKVFIGVALFPVLYGSLWFFAWRALNFSFLGFFLATALMPMFTIYHMTLLDERYQSFKEVVAAWRMFVAVSGGKEQRREVEEVVQLRRWCAEEVKRILWNEARKGNKDAEYLVEYGAPLFNGFEEEK
ncbi:hypothetical protein BC937DRAFT_91915, partial [Endogone sp. FLAS-F59071]